MVASLVSGPVYLAGEVVTCSIALTNPTAGPKVLGSGGKGGMGEGSPLRGGREGDKFW